MKRRILIPCVALVLLLVFGVAGARADMVNPFGLGALGAGLGYIAGGNARSAAIGGVAGMGAGIILNAAQRPWYGYYDGPRYGYYTYGVGYAPPPPVFVGPPPYHGHPGPWRRPPYRHCHAGHCGPPGPPHWR